MCYLDATTWMGGGYVLIRNPQLGFFNYPSMLYFQIQPSKHIHTFSWKYSGKNYQETIVNM